jgi:hypothetical protein
MSWLFSRALVEACESLRSSLERVEAFSAASCSDGEPSAQLNVMPTQHPFWLKDKTMEASRFSRFGLTCRVLTEDRGAALLTWYLEDFPAKTSRQPARVEASKASALDSGDKWPESWVKYDRATSSWRTRQRSLAGDWEEFSETWPRSGSMRNGMCFQRPTLAPTICGNESGLLPTPRASDGMKHRIRPASVVRASKRGHAGRLEDWVSLKEEITKNQCVYLNPGWLESLMKWPIEWSALTPLETDKFQEWLQQHGASSEAA